LVDLFELFNKMPFFTSVALVVVCSVLLVYDISETVFLHNILKCTICRRI